jgi:hypothetical protein
MCGPDGYYLLLLSRLSELPPVSLLSRSRRLARVFSKCSHRSTGGTHTLHAHTLNPTLTLPRTSPPFACLSLFLPPSIVTPLLAPSVAALLSSLSDHSLVPPSALSRRVSLSSLPVGPARSRLPPSRSHEYAAWLSHCTSALLLSVLSALAFFIGTAVRVPRAVRHARGFGRFVASEKCAKTCANTSSTGSTNACCANTSSTVLTPTLNPGFIQQQHPVQCRWRAPREI